jgi:hypothetical protein
VDGDQPYPAENTGVVQFVKVGLGGSSQTPPPTVPTLDHPQCAEGSRASSLGGEDVGKTVGVEVSDDTPETIEAGSRSSKRPAETRPGPADKRRAHEASVGRRTCDRCGVWFSGYVKQCSRVCREIARLRPGGGADFGTKTKGPASSANITKVSALPRRPAPPPIQFRRYVAPDSPIKSTMKSYINYCPTRIVAPGPPPGRQCFKPVMRYAGGGCIVLKAWEELASDATMQDLQDQVNAEFLLRVLRGTKLPRGAFELFQLPPGIYLVLTRIKLALLDEHWSVYDAFRRTLYIGDGDIIILEPDDWTERSCANKIFTYLGLTNIRQVAVLMHTE